MALTINQLANQPEVQFIDVDPVSGKNRYYNSKTGLYSLSDATPTADQQTYHDAQVEPTPPTPPAEPGSYDSAAGQIDNTTPASQSNEGALSTAETQNLDAPNTANNPDAGEAIKTGIVPSEAALADPTGAAKTAAAQIAGTNVNNPNAVTPTSTSPDAPNITKPLPNRLKSYPSYIYSLSLHLLSDKDYNDTVQSQTYTPKNVLVASAGRYNTTNFPRNKFFNDDFYFDDLSLITVISPNDNSRNTNAIEGSFTLLEPYGFTFVERLLEAAKEIKSQNYLDMPYLLQIDFFAMDDSGNIVGSTGVEDLRKRIPIKITKMDINITVKGAEYKINYVPFNHTAYDTSTCSTPANFEITAGRIEEFFQSVEGTSADSLAAENAVHAQNQRAEAEAAAAQAAPPPINAANFAAGTGGGQRLTAANFASGGVPTKSPQNKTPQPSKTSYTKVKSYGTAINAWNEVLYKYNKISAPDTYRFEFPTVTLDDGSQVSIGKFAFTDQLRHTPKETKMVDNVTPGDVAAMKKADLGQTTSTTTGSTAQNVKLYDLDKALFQVQAGTTIEKLIDYIVRNSDYIQNQLIVPEEADYEAKKAELKDKPLYWYKIIPTVTLESFDDRRKVWSRTITYSVIPYKMYNIRLDVGPQGVQLYPSKKYDYIYTGTNDDVIDFDIKFNTLFYNQVTAYRNSLAELNPTGASAVEQGLYPNFSSYKGGETQNTADYNAVMPLTMKTVVQNSRSNATGGANTAKETAAVDLEASIMTNSDADMLNVKLKILGDPDYIKQDDVFYRPPLDGTNVAVVPSVDPRLLPNNGSLVMDQGGLYIQLLFRIPQDIDENTGLMKFNPKYKQSVFSGLYLIQKITSHFSRGQFIQELDMVRLPRQQAFDYINAQQGNSDNRKELAGQTQTNLGIMPAGTSPSTAVPGGGAPASPADQADTQIDQTAGGDQPIAQAENAEAPVQSAEQAALSEVNNTAPDATINDNNQPQTNTPTPVGGTKLADGSVLYNGPATPENSIRGVSADGQQIPVGVSQNVASGVYQYKGVNLPGAADDPAVMNKLVSAINSGSTTVYSYEDPVSGKTFTRTFNGATGTSN